MKLGLMMLEVKFIEEQCFQTYAMKKLIIISYRHIN